MQNFKKGCVRGFHPQDATILSAGVAEKVNFTFLAHRVNKMTIMDL
jgi:hypothetical protein